MHIVYILYIYICIFTSVCYLYNTAGLILVVRFLGHFKPIMLFKSWPGRVYVIISSHDIYTHTTPNEAYISTCSQTYTCIWMLYIYTLILCMYIHEYISIYRASHLLPFFHTHTYNHWLYCTFMRWILSYPASYTCVL